MDGDFMFLTIQRHLDSCVCHRAPMRRALASLFLPGEGVHNLYDRNLILRAQEQEEAKEEDEYERDHHPEHFLEHRLFLFSFNTV